MERIVRALAWALPRRVAYWCFIRLTAHATSGQWGNTDPGTLSVMDALKRCEDWA